MIFTDWIFFVFFAVAFSVYWVIPYNRTRKLWLLACSAVFYAAWDWRFLGLVLLVIINTYATTLLVHRTDSQTSRRRILTLGIVVSLSVLGFFKYYNFFVDLLAEIVPLDLTIRQILLPIGIPAFTHFTL